MDAGNDNHGEPDQNRRRLIAAGLGAALLGPTLLHRQGGSRSISAAGDFVDPELLLVDGAPVAGILALSGNGRWAIVYRGQPLSESGRYLVDLATRTSRLLPTQFTSDGRMHPGFDRINTAGTLAYWVESAEAPDPFVLVVLDVATLEQHSVELDLSTPGQNFVREQPRIVDISADGSVTALTANQSGYTALSFLADASGKLIDPGVDGIQVDDDVGRARLHTLSPDGKRVTYATGQDGDITDEWVEWNRTTDVRIRFPTPASRSVRQTADRTLNTFVGLLFPDGFEVYDRSNVGSNPTYPGSLRQVVATESGRVLLSSRVPGGNPSQLHAVDPGALVARPISYAPGTSPTGGLLRDWHTDGAGDVVGFVSNNAALSARTEPEGSVFIVGRPPPPPGGIDQPAPSGQLRPAERRPAT